jgi:diguanylate cyclase (GGDEF)-like protein
MFEELASARERGPGDMVDEVLLILDTGEGRLTYVSQEASAFFAIPPNLLTGSTAVSLIPELESLVPRDFETRIATAQGPRDVSVCVRALAGATPAVMVTLRSIASNRAIASRGARLESLWTLVVRRGLGGADYVRAILHEALVGIGLEHASLARVDGDALEVEERDSGPALASRIAIDRTVAGAAVLRSGTFAVLDTADSTEFIALADGLRCVLASAFRVGDERYVLTFGSTIPRTEPFGLDDWRYVDTVVEALSRGIERRESDARIQRLAYVDALTGLPNRGALHARLDEALAESERLGARTAVLFLDIDGFKAVNDTVGHRGGDTVLAEVAQRLRGTLRREEYIGRLGGDEFAIVMPHIADRHEISSIAQRIGGVLTFPFCVDAYRFSLSASIGVAIYPDDAANRDELLACADAAMYSAKGDGGARIRFGGAESDPAIAIASANASASFAGETRDVGYILCYQPILDIAAGRVLAAEALIRRIHPVHGLLAPERGWSIAEDDGGRRALDRWVLREATMQARMWSLAGSPIRIDVNLAAFDQRDIDVLLADETLASDVRRLRIEIVPEQFADAERRDQLPAFVDHCARNGIGLVLDGFDGSLGTLSSLAHLPIDAVKLERSLVESIGGSGTARAVIEGTVIVAKSLGWSVIAKGVETAAQQEALIALGCDAIQGFFVAHPMTAMDFGTWLRDRHAIGRQA